MELIEAVRQYGHDIGIAFQIIDDVFDFTSDQTILGKPVGSDLRQGLVTLPAIYFVEENPEDIDARLDRWKMLSGCRYFNRLVDKIRLSPAVDRALEMPGPTWRARSPG